MKKDIFLIAVVVIIFILIFNSLFQIGLVIKIIISILLVGLFLYKQTKPHKNLLFPKYQQWFSYLETMYDWVFKVLKFTPIKIGDSLLLDTASFIMLIVLVILLIQ